MNQNRAKKNRPQTTKSSKKIIANEIVLTDGTGTPRILITADKESVPSLSFFDDKGVERMTLFCTDRGPSVVMTDERGFLRQMVYVDDSGPDLLMIDRQGQVAYSARR